VSEQQTSLDDLEQALAGIPELELARKEDRLRIGITQIQAQVTITAAELVQAESIPDPAGGTAVRILLTNWPGTEELRELIIAEGDLVLQPHTVDTGVPGVDPAQVPIEPLPDLVAYSELVLGLGRLAVVLAHESDREARLAHLVKHYYFIGGAARWGFDVTDLRARWLELRQRYLDPTD
jgi:hypothetical protein